MTNISINDIDTQGKTKGQIKTFCPLCHKDRRHQSDPEFSVNLTDGAYNCHHCGVIGRLVEYRGTPFTDDGEKKHYIKPNEAEIVKVTVPLADHVLEYFKNRGISEDTILAWNITYGVSFSEHDGQGRFSRDEAGVPVVHNAIRFPFYEYDEATRRNELVYIKHFRPKEWQTQELADAADARGTVDFPGVNERWIRAEKQGKPVPFGLENCGKRIVMVEGEIDAMSVWEAGIHEVISMPNGANNFKWLEFESVTRKLKAADVVYIAGDTDADGMASRAELERRLQQLLGPEHILIVNWPEDCKDANDVLVNYGPEVVVDAIENAEHLPMDGISSCWEFMDEYMSFYDNGVPKGFDIGFPDMEPYFRVMPGHVTIVSGVTNYGKSEVLDEIIRLMAENHKWKFAIYTPENFPFARHMMKLAQKVVGKPADREKTGHMTREEYAEAGKWLAEHIYYINPRSTIYTVQEIITRARFLVFQKGINGLVIDPWNYVKMPPASGLLPDQINEQMQEIGVFSKDTQVHTFIVVHPKTLRRDKEGTIQTPTVHDLYGGSKFGDNADSILVIERYPKEADETGEHRVTIHNQKARYSPAGRQGHFDVGWDKFSGRFYTWGQRPQRPRKIEDDFDNIDMSEYDQGGDDAEDPITF